MKRKLRRIKRKIRRIDIKYIIILVFLIIIIIILLIKNITINYNNINNLLDESNTINKNLDITNLNSKYINNISKKTITKGKYIEVEEAIEEYTKDYNNLLKEITTSLKDTTYTNLLTSSNYQASILNNFSDNFTYIEKKSTAITNLEKQLKVITTKSSYNKYIINKTKDIKLINLYDECIINIISTNDIKTLETSLEDANYILVNTKDILNFLNMYKDYWHIENNNIVFSNEDLLDSYNSKINIIKNIN